MKSGRDGAAGLDGLAADEAAVVFCGGGGGGGAVAGDIVKSSGELVRVPVKERDDASSARTRPSHIWKT